MRAYTVDSVCPQGEKVLLSLTYVPVGPGQVRDTEKSGVRLKGRKFALTRSRGSRYKDAYVLGLRLKAESKKRKDVASSLKP